MTDLTNVEYDIIRSSAYSMITGDYTVNFKQELVFTIHNVVCMFKKLELKVTAI